MRKWATLIAVVLAVPAMAEPTSPRLTLERVFASPDLAGPQPRALKLSPDGTLLTSLRPRSDDKERLDLWATDTRTGAERMLVDSRTVGSGAALSEAEKMQRERARIGGQTGIVGYDWTADGRLLVPLDGDLFVATVDGHVSRLTRGLIGGALNPAMSPRGTHVSYVQGQNLFVQEPLGCTPTPAPEGLSPDMCGAVRKLTSDGGGTVHWGEAEFVAQEEMDRTTGYWWSPDERTIAVERFDEAPVHVATRAAIGASGTTTFEQRYPAAGTPNVAVELHLIRADGSGSVKVDLGRDPDIYLARVDWLPDGSAVIVQRENRAQTKLDVLKVDPATGASIVLFSETAAAKSWINLSDAYRWLNDGSLIWRSERDGYGHLWRWQDGVWTQLTKGAWVVSGLVAVDEAHGRAFFTGNKDGVLEQHLYALDLTTKAVTRLTEPGWWNAATANSAGTRFIVTRSNPRQPSQTYLADASGTRLSWVSENRVQGTHPYAPYLPRHRDTEFGTIKAADGSVLHWEMISPVREPGKRYPVFFEHYGGPGSQQVTRAWQGALAQYLVDQGWVYFRIDNRGSPGRGQAFEDQIWRAMGTVEVADQAAGARYLVSLPFVDPDKIATFGWSYGGYMSLKMLEQTPGLYAAAVAGAPVTDWRLYDTHYTERYMGDPGKVARAYDASGAIVDVGRIRDPLLLIHGMADDNVFLTHSTLFAAEMQKQDVPFEMMLYPGYTHTAARSAVAVHLWGTILSFLDRTVKNKPAK